MQDNIIVKTSKGPVEIRRLAMNDYAELLKVLQNMPEELGSFIDKSDSDDFNDTAKLFAVLPPIIASALPQFCALLACTTNKDQKFHQFELDLADNTEILVAALQLNDYMRIWNSIKKLIPRLQKKGSKKTKPQNQASGQK